MDNPDQTTAPTTVVNWLLLGELCVVVIVALAFLLYFNRLFGSVLAFFIRLITWRKHHAYISIGSLQFAPLAGRIGFRNVEYHSSNLSLRILHGHITFRYWARRPRQEGDSESGNTKRAKNKCRLVVFIDGVECFVYNRTPAYDAIVERMKKHERENRAQTSTLSKDSSSDQNPIKVRLRKAFRTAHDEDGLAQLNSTTSSNESNEKPHVLPDALHPVEIPQTDGVDWFRELLPIELRVEKGSVVLGSDATPMVLIGDFKRADGTVEISDSRSICDKYKMSIALQFQEVKVLYRTNVEWSGPLLAHGKKVYDDLIRQDPDLVKQPPSSLSTKSAFIAHARKFPFLKDPSFSKPPRAGMPRDRTWRGLARYRSESTKEAPKHEREYAKVATLVDTPQLDFTYYSDTPGLVPHPSEIEVPDVKDEYGNIDLPPEYGMDIVIHGGLVQYGPWADRQREALQKTFAPSIFFDTETRPRLRTGETRVHADLVLKVDFSEETNLRIPTREPSKDWRFDAKPDADLERPYGWLDVTTAANSSIRYTQSQYATSRGYDANLVLHLDSLSIASSINLQSFVDAKACKLTLSMPTPLRWDAQRNWGIDMNFDTPNITPLRDHVTLISDLAKDWSGGVAGDFHHFVPVHYNFKISMKDYAVHLYINDSNIVDRPQSRDDNAFVDILGPSLSAYVAIASTQYRPEFSVIPFTANLEDTRLELSLPKWDTHKSFQSAEPIKIGRIGKGSAKGSYRYYSTPHPDHEENLTLHLDASKVAFKCMGWVLRRLFCVKDNYFGMFTQFTTTQEYLERFDHDPNSVGDPVEEKYRPGRSDPFAVQVTLDVKDSLLLLSDEIYACESGLGIPIPQLQMMLKSVETFMELSLDLPPTYIVATPSISSAYEVCIAPPPSSTESVFIEGIIVKANRLFGPQPHGTTYLCLWEVELPKVSAFLTPAFLSTVRSSVTAVAFNFSDKENAPTDIYIPATPPDVTFLRLSLGSAAIVLSAGDAGIAIDLAQGVTLDTSTLATLTASSSLSVVIPSLTSTLLSRTSSRKKWTSAGTLQSGLSIDRYKAPKEWQEKAQKQQKFLREEDKPTQRIWYMYSEKEDLDVSRHNGSGYLPRPHMMDNGMDDSDSDNEGFDNLDQDDISDEDEPRPARPSFDRRSRSRSFMTAKENLLDSDSLSDESDDVSSIASSASSRSRDSFHATMSRDMASILADHHRNFKTSRPSTILPITHLPHEQAELRQSTKPLSNGSLTRIKIEPVVMEGSLARISVIAAILAALSVNHSRPLQLLDSALDGLMDEFSDRNDRPVPSILDISAPSIRALVSTGTPDLEPVSRISLEIGGLGGRLSQEPAEASTPANTSASITLASLRSTVFCTSPIPSCISLSDIDTPELPSDGLPVLQFDQLGLRASLDDKAEDRQIRVQSTTTDIKVVSSAFTTIRNTAEIWSKQLNTFTSVQKETPPLAFLLSTILSASGTTFENSPQPAFVSELTYELHVDDDRNIRRDHGWRVLARLRQIVLRGLAGSGDEQAPSLAPGVVISALARLDWIPDDNNEDLTRQLTFVRKSFDLPSAPMTNKSLTSQSAFIGIESISIRHYDYLLGGIRNIGSSYIHIGTSSIGGYRTQLPGAEKQDKAIIAISSIKADVRDSIFSAIHLIQSTSTSISPSSPIAPSVILSGDETFLVNATLGSAELAITAGGLRLRTVVTDTTGTMAHAQRQHKRNGVSSHVTVKNDSYLVLDKAEVVLWQPAEEGDLVKVPDREVIIVGIGGLKVVSNTEGSSKIAVVKEQRILLSLESMKFDSRPTLRKALDFAQHWQEKHYPHYEPTITQIRSSMANNPARVPQPRQAPTNLTFDILVHQADLTVRTAHSAWIGWKVKRIYACERGSVRNHSFGIRAEPQSIGFYSTRELVKKKDTVKLELPQVHIDGTLKTVRHRKEYNVLVNLGQLKCVVKPSALDKWLSLYKTMVPEIRKLVKDYGSYATSLFSPPTPSAIPAAPTKSPLFRLQIGVEMISISLQADDVATILTLQAHALKGQASNRDARNEALSWSAGVSHFEVSLGRMIDDASLARSSIPAKVSRKHKTAYMYLDVDVSESPGDIGAPSRLDVKLSRIQTFMHIAALSEISDLISSWTSDLHVLTDQRGTDVAEVRQTTSRFLKKIDTSDRFVQPEESWFATRLLEVNITSFGVAIPLGSETTIDIQPETTSALLFSVKTIKFTNRRNETARFQVQHIALQFVDTFDRNKSEHFVGGSHSTLNQMDLPYIDAEAQMSSKSDASWTLAAHCQATDFNLQLNPDFIRGIFQLIDLYEQGRDRMDRLEKRYRAELARNAALSSLDDQEKTQEVSPVTARVNQRIYLRLSFTFESGKVQLYRAAENGKGGMIREWHDDVVLPKISVWVDYAGPSTDGLADKQDSAGLIILNAAIHQSRNTLRPSILPFFVQVAKRVQERFKAKQDNIKPSPTSPIVEVPITTPQTDLVSVVSTKPTGSINRLRLTLRIDQSELRFACVPDSQAYINLRWESGGFIASTTLGSEEISTFGGTISGVSTNLGHEYDQLGRSCIEASARDLAFSVIHTPDWRDGQAGISVVIDTRVSAQFKLDLFSAWLIFIAVWVDNAGLDGPIIAAIADPSAVPIVVPSASTVDRKHIGLAVVARFQAIDFDADVSISKTKLNISPVILHTLSDGTRTRVDLQIGKIEVTGKGDINGTITVNDFSFNTKRKSTRATEDLDPQLLVLQLRSGDMRGSLFLKESNIARFHLGPSIVSLSDDWKDPSIPPMLAFAVNAGKLSAVARLLAIPQLLGRVYDILDAVSKQHTIASQRSEIFKTNKAAKAINPSSISAALAQTMQRTTSNQEQVIPDGCDTVFSQTMEFKLGGIEVGAYNEGSEEESSRDFYHFMIGPIGAELLREPRQVDGNDIPHRDLKLSVGYVRWNTVPGSQVSSGEKKESTAEEMLFLATKNGSKAIASLPSLELKMDSDEYKGTPRKILYHFDLYWGSALADISLLPVFYDETYRALKKLIAGIEEQEVARLRRQGKLRPIKPSEAEKKEKEKREQEEKKAREKEEKKQKQEGKGKGKEGESGSEDISASLLGSKKILFLPRNPEFELEPPIPQLRPLGPTTRDAARLVPRFTQLVRDLPITSHQFVTTSLEEGMDLLLKLYAKQLPVKKG